MAWDSTVGAFPESYFTVAFIGTTPENKDRTMHNKGDPEDRIFVFREPFLTTRFNKSADKVEFMYRCTCPVHMCSITADAAT